MAGSALAAGFQGRAGPAAWEPAAEQAFQVERAAREFPEWAGRWAALYLSGRLPEPLQRLRRRAKVRYAWVSPLVEEATQEGLCRPLHH